MIFTTRRCLIRMMLYKFRQERYLTHRGEGISTPLKLKFAVPLKVSLINIYAYQGDTELTRYHLMVLFIIEQFPLHVVKF